MALDGKRLLKYMAFKGYEIEPWNIVYIEDCDPDTWQPIAGRLDKWDDARSVVTNEGIVLFSNIATSEPGAFYTNRPLNPNGAARIALMQHKDAWALGDHKGQPALVQVGNLKIHRDLNQDGLRIGDPIFTGDGYGINQHSTSPSFSNNSVGKWSAGCLVGKFYSSHLNFIELCREIQRKTGKKRFTSTIIDASDFAKFAG
ncbi:hypothetical protein ACE1B6_24345 [Aerosakkonemataceae cyanobacterium BLCC-F154]|uniref:Uncharacterized protein n=1 Tax=Floridaenema fluviatile BLCC-F154 TaxID=3153640 RepID=A0ABV4YHT2_9CYAN